MNVEEILKSSQARKEYLGKIEQRGMQLDTLNISCNPLEPGARGEQHAKDLYRSFEVAESLGIDTLVSQTGCPAGNAQDTCVNWVTSSFRSRISISLNTNGMSRSSSGAPREEGRRTRHQENRLREPSFKHGLQRPNAQNPEKRTRPIIGMNLDPSHVFFMGGDPIEMARVLCAEGSIYHVHGKDARINKAMRAIDMIETQPFWAPAADRTWNYVAVGYGHDELWWREFFATLTAGNYSGPVSIEVEDFLMSSNMMAIKTSAEFLQNTMLP